MTKNFQQAIFEGMASRFLKNYLTHAWNLIFWGGQMTSFKVAKNSEIYS